MSKLSKILRQGAQRPVRCAPLRIWRRSLAIALAISVSAPALADQSVEKATRDPVPLEIFQQKEDRLFKVGFRLAIANASFCDGAVPVAGFLIHDADSYGNPDAVRMLFDLRGDIGVQSVAPGSPAALAGIGQNDTIAAIGNDKLADWPKTEQRWKRVFSIRDALDAALAKGPVGIEWLSKDGAQRTATLAGIPACPTRFELVDSKSNAAADGDRVLVGENFPGFAYDEESFAAAIAHEMAHNIFRHPQTFNEIGWKRKLVRLSERDADRLMPWLLANAGYDPRAAIRFMQTWGPKHGGWIFRKRTHDGWDERTEFIEAEIKRIEAARARAPDGRADWSADFHSELAPALAQRTR